jgi:hypothetical protein
MAQQVAQAHGAGQRDGEILAVAPRGISLIQGVLWRLDAVAQWLEQASQQRFAPGTGAEGGGRDHRGLRFGQLPKLRDVLFGDAQLHGLGWQVETALRDLKTTMRVDVLPCKTVPGVLKEVIVLAIVYNPVRIAM